jgi:hypothetical protein
MEQQTMTRTARTAGARRSPYRSGPTARTCSERAFTHLFEGEYDRAEMAYRAALCLSPVDSDVMEDLESIGRALSRFRA